MTQGRLITIEGGEGVGKTTQIPRLAKSLRGLGYDCLCTREPGGTELGQTLRSLLLHSMEHDPAPTTQLLLYAADRAEHVAKVIRPALQRGQFVLCDRFIDSTLAYQGYGQQLDLELIHQLNQIATQGITPDLTLWLNLPVDQGLTRAQQRSTAQADPTDPETQINRMEAEEIAFHQRLYQGFQKLAHGDPERIQPIEAQGSVEEVAERIWQGVAEHLSRWG